MGTHTTRQRVAETKGAALSIRICDISISNKGTGFIKLIDKSLSHGEWIDGWNPSTTASNIGPGEAKRFESSEGGDIPLFGSVLTGNEGWVLYETLVASKDTDRVRERAFVKISWNLPYTSFSSAGVGVAIQATRYDPRISPSGTEFDERDKRPSSIVISAFGGSPGGPSDLKQEIASLSIGTAIGQAVPGGWVSAVILGLSDFNGSATAGFDFLNTIAPEDTTLPPPQFSDAPPPTTKPKALVNTIDTMWTGTWSGPDRNIRIWQSDEPAALVVDTTPFAETRQTQLVHVVRRAELEAMVTEPSPPSLVTGLVTERGTGFAHVLGEPRLHHGAAIAESGAGLAGALGDRLSGEAGVRAPHLKIAGDYAKVEPNGVLEIYGLMVGDEQAGTVLRFRQPFDSDRLGGPLESIDVFLDHAPIVS